MLLTLIRTCGVIRGKVTSAACLFKGQHPYTGTGGPATAPAPLKGGHKHNHTSNQSDLLIYIQQLMSVLFCELSGTFAQIDWVLKQTRVYEMERKCSCSLTWLDSLCSVLMPGRSCTDRRLGGSHVAADKEDTRER